MPPPEAPCGRRALSFSSLGSDCAEEKAPAKGDGGAECAVRARKRKADVATVSAGPAARPGARRPAPALPGRRAQPSGPPLLLLGAGGHAVAWALGGRWSAAGLPSWAF